MNGALAYGQVTPGWYRMSYVGCIELTIAMVSRAEHHDFTVMHVIRVIYSHVLKAS